MYAHPLNLAGPIIEAPLPGVAIGEICDIRRNWSDRKIVARAQVVGFRQDVAILSLIGQSKGLSRQALLMPTGASLTVEIGPAMLGAVIDPSGNVMERFCNQAEGVAETLTLDAAPPQYGDRELIGETLVTGVRAIDGLLTCGVGQRIGIFASAGCGKTTLMNMIIDHADADVFVVGLIGERGREVTEFAHTLRASDKRNRCVLVYATSDFSSVDRCNAALLATTVAEFFRDRGLKVVLFMDSITRYARALRDVALAAGESPARRGYPASVFDALPRLLERPGVTRRGSITAFYTILLESDDEPDPIADEIRSILDGHIYLDRKLAAQGHFPSIDVLRSASRVALQITDEEHQRAAMALRGLLAKLEDLQVFLDLGEYKEGQNQENDGAMERRPAVQQWLRQHRAQSSPLRATLEAMHGLVA
ncbi:type III secretion system ATPase SctN [Glaciimonas sp. PCH181]|uniref:type III secretion system ATPase SctN n=1 Tax=Glaciimonas sp. PCH181 TaxID=2133943 RepID=UPI0021060F6D